MPDRSRFGLHPDRSVEWSDAGMAVNAGTVLDQSIGLAADSVDLCFSNGAFIEFKLGTILLFAKEFWRILKRNGYVIFDYIDISTEEAWQHLKSQSAVHHRTFTYHCGHTIDKVFASVGFTVLERHQEDKSTYVVFQKI